VAIALLACAGGFLQARSRSERVPAHAPLSSFPEALGSWAGKDVEIPPAFLDVLGPGEFLSRIYQAPAEPYIDFFLAYFPSQKTGDTIHSPKNCLPGAGWTPIEAGRMQLAEASGPPINVNRYVLEKNGSHMFVLYWYQAHGRAVANEYWAKYFLVADAIRTNRTDGALIRVITPMAFNEDVTTSEKRAAGFARQILPLLNRYVPK
jgi:EpsI family protein